MADQDYWLISKLVQGLNAPNKEIRKKSVGALRVYGKLATAAIPAITQLLYREADPLVKAEARRALRSLQQHVA